MAFLGFRSVVFGSHFLEIWQGIKNQQINLSSGKMPRRKIVFPSTMSHQHPQSDRKERKKKNLVRHYATKCMKMECISITDWRIPKVEPIPFSRERYMQRNEALFHDITATVEETLTRTLLSRYYYRLWELGVAVPAMMFVKWLALQPPKFWQDYWRDNIESDSVTARVMFNARHRRIGRELTYWTGTSISQLCESRDTKELFEWLRDEAKTNFPDPTELAGTDNPLQYHWQPPSFLHHLQGRTDTHTYIGHKITRMTKHAVLEGRLRHHWGPLFIDRWCELERELVHVVVMSPHTFPCGLCTRRYGMHANHVGGQSKATITTLTRTRCVEYTRISRTCGAVLFKGVTFLRHDPYGCKIGPTPLPVDPILGDVRDREQPLGRCRLTPFPDTWDSIVWGLANVDNLNECSWSEYTRVSADRKDC